MRIAADFHVHSCHSLDSRQTLAEIAAAAQKCGLSALSICDHNDCSIFEDLPSDRMINGVLILPGVEISTDSGHLLGLFLEKPVDLAALRRNENIKCTASDAAFAVIAAGGIAVAAHPYENPRAPEKSERLIAAAAAANALLPEADGKPFHGIEIFNAKAESYRNHANPRAAETAAETAAPICTAGSDAHFPREIGNVKLFLEVDGSLTPASLRKALLQGGCGWEAECRGTHSFRRAEAQLVKHLKARRPLPFLKYIAITAARAADDFGRFIVHDKARSRRKVSPEHRK